MKSYRIAEETLNAMSLKFNIVTDKIIIVSHMYYCCIAINIYCIFW